MTTTKGCKQVLNFPIIHNHQCITRTRMTSVRSGSGTAGLVRGQLPAAVDLQTHVGGADLTPGVPDSQGNVMLIDPDRDLPLGGRLY